LKNSHWANKGTINPPEQQSANQKKSHNGNIVREPSGNKLNLPQNVNLGRQDACEIQKIKGQQAKNKKRYGYPEELNFQIYLRM
jgi:hypothetical protein